MCEDNTWQDMDKKAISWIMIVKSEIKLRRLFQVERWSTPAIIYSDCSQIYRGCTIIRVRSLDEKLHYFMRLDDISLRLYHWMKHFSYTVLSCFYAMVCGVGQYIVPEKHFCNISYPNITLSGSPSGYNEWKARIWRQHCPHNLWWWKQSIKVCENKYSGQTNIS